MKKINQKVKRRLRNRKKLKGVNNARFRISVSKSLNNYQHKLLTINRKKH